MSAASNGRVLRIAIGASLAVHLVFAAVVYSHPVTAAPEQQPHGTTILHLPPPTPTPPPPKPALPHPQRKSAAFVPRVHAVKLIAKSDNPKGPSELPPPQPTGDPNIAQTPGPDVAPTAAPFVPTPTPKPACSAPDVAAKTIDAQTPDKPDDAQAQGLVGTVKIKVDLDASGAVVGASIFESSGSMELDQAALSAARASRYAPQERDCKNVPGSYLFTVDFQ
jgi:protein TonB